MKLDCAVKMMTRPAKQIVYDRNIKRWCNLVCLDCCWLLLRAFVRFSGVASCLNFIIRKGLLLWLEDNRWEEVGEIEIKEITSEEKNARFSRNKCIRCVVCLLNLAWELRRHWLMWLWKYINASAAKMLRIDISMQELCFCYPFKVNTLDKQ